MIFTKGRQIMNRNSYKMSGKAIKLYRIRLVLLAVAVSFFCGGVMVFSVEIALVLIAFWGIAVCVLIIWLPLFIYSIEILYHLNIPHLHPALAAVCNLYPAPFAGLLQDLHF